MEPDVLSKKKYSAGNAAQHKHTVKVYLLKYHLFVSPLFINLKHPLSYFFLLHFSLTYFNREVQPRPWHSLFDLFFYCYWSITSATGLKCHRKWKFRFSSSHFCWCNSGSLPHSFHCRLKQEIREGEKQSCFTFTGSLQVSLQAAGRAAVLRAAEASARTAGGAWEFTDTILVVVTTTSRHRAARHLPARRFTAKTRMIA